MGQRWIVFAGGGTGGHLFPALAVADEIRRREAGVEISFYVTQRAFDAETLGPTGYEVVPQEVRPFTLHPLRAAGFVRSWQRSCAAAARRFGERRPAVVVGAGGYAAGPPLRVAQRLGIPTAILNPDAVPGRANRYLGRRAAAVFAQWECTAQHFARPEVVETTGCPVRGEFLRAERAAGIVRFGLDAGKRTLLVTGASQGARSINLALVELRGELAKAAGWQVLHLTGREDEERMRGAYAEAGVAAVVVAFTREMAEALAAADLVISRAGASTLAELAAVGRAAVLLPYPYHKDQHQRHNAEELVRAGAAELVEDRIEGEANAAALRGVLARLMGDAGAVDRMSAAARGMGRREAAEAVAERILALADS